jgi:nicotinate-nucleotide--dimethylbenzimidazole phosphoribosyltransferase
MDLPKILSSIPPLDEKAMDQAERHQDRLAKPVGSLGWLEDIAIQVAGITGEAIPRLGKKRVLLVAGDHGVAAEGPGEASRVPTRKRILQALRGGAAINALARQARAELQVADLGTVGELPKHKGLLKAKVAEGTMNFLRGPAMTPDGCARAFETGLALAEKAAKDRTRWVILGEMGAGNSVSAAALMAGLLPCAVEDVTGNGLPRTHWSVHCRVVQEALTRHQPLLSQPLEALRRLGGFETAALVGLILGCAKNRIPMVADGFNTSAAFLVAYRLSPKVLDFTFFSHFSEEPGHGKFFEMLETGPILDLSLRLGEGTGGALALNILEGALRVHAEMDPLVPSQIPAAQKKKKGPGPQLPLDMDPP